MTALDAVIDLLQAAISSTAAHVNRTEVRDLGWMTRFARRPVAAKLENNQVTGSFKVRGALFALSRLPAGSAVVAPSAGNHGLAVAWAASQLRMQADIFLPENASPLKRERILRLGAGVIEAGSTVEAAGAEARRSAAVTGRTYIAPFDDLAVMAGQGTAVLELLTQRPDLTSLMIPVGGGGLLAGALAARAFLGRDRLRIVACEPAAFASLSATVSAGTPVRLARRPTFADGLATNIDAGARTVEIARAANNLSFVSLTENELAAGCTALFNRESILSEAAGAAGLVATLHSSPLDLPEGPIGTLICGGNVHHATFWQMTSMDLRDPRLFELADTMGRTVDDDPGRRANPAPDERRLILASDAAEQAARGDADAGVSRELLSNVRGYCQRTDDMLIDLLGLVKEQDLPLDEAALGLTRSVNQQVYRHAEEPGPDSSEIEREQRVRALSQLAVAARMAFEWRSPAYDQSAALSGLDLGAQGSPGINYARYDQPGVAEIERQLIDVTKVDPRTQTVLLTSSGMAAFALLAGTLLGHGGIRSALLAPYLYFEGEEMLRHWLGLGIDVASGFDGAEIAAQRQRGGHDAVFADPLANHAEQRMIDIEALAGCLSTHDHPPWLVVDGTMLPATVTRALTRSMPERTVYHESCSKYLQLGLDVAMAGLVVLPRSLEARARRVRRDLGLGLDRYGAELFPRYQPQQLEHRLARMEQAAQETAERLAELIPAHLFTVCFPGLSSHPDHRLARSLGRTGSCITLAPVHTRLTRDQLDPIVDEAIRVARRNGTPLVKGVSFGFSTSRLSAASAMAEGTPPFLRLAVGTCDADVVEGLSEALFRAVLGVRGAGHARLTQ